MVKVNISGCDSFVAAADYQNYVQNQKHISISGNEENVPCQFLNCFCMYSDYIPMTLDEWIKIDQKRRMKL